MAWQEEDYVMAWIILCGAIGFLIGGFNGAAVGLIVGVVIVGLLG